MDTSLQIKGPPRPGLGIGLAAGFALAINTCREIWQSVRAWLRITPNPSSAQTEPHLRSLDTTDRLSAALRRCRTGLLWACALGCLINLLVLTVPLYTMQVFDRVLVSKSVATLFYLSVIGLAGVALYGGLEAIRSRLLVRMSAWLEQVVAPTTFERALEFSLRGQNCAGEALRDVTNVRQFVGGPGTLALLDAPWMPLFLVLVFLLHPLLGLISCGGAAALFCLGLVMEKVTHPPLQAANAASVRALRTAEMAARNAEVVEGMGMNAAIANRWALDNVRAAKLQSQASDSAGTIHAVTKSFRLALQLLILGAGAYLAVGNELSPGGMIAASIIMGRALAPVELAIGTWRQAISAAESYKRLRLLLGSPPLRPESLRLPRPRGVVSAEQVTYVPPGSSEPIVRENSFQVSPGEALGIVGPSGAGKTTLARLLTGTLKPTRGLVRVDGADVFARNRSEIGRWMGYLPQNVELFEGTVADNIARMGDVNPRQVVRAAELADAHDMILRLPNGYDTQVGEGGIQLSGGQRQRMGLARALLGSPAVVVLDEPNSNLDAEGEQALNKAIASLKELGSTVIVIGHRPSVMLHVDRILVLRQGRVDLLGPKQSVMEKITRLSVKTLADASGTVSGSGIVQA